MQYIIKKTIRYQYQGKEENHLVYFVDQGFFYPIFMSEISLAKIYQNKGEACIDLSFLIKQNYLDLEIIPV